VVETEQDVVVRHYETIREEQRLAGGLAELELVRTREILRRHLPPPPARVLDVGGGTGVHAGWLLADGYEVHLVDLTPRHVERAVVELGPLGLTAAVGDARHLDQPDGSFDAVLLLGPLYHLIERTDRVAALGEARRVVRPGGVVAAAAISRFASLFDGLSRQFLFDPAFRAIVRGDLRHGRHTNPEDRPHWFTTAFFHHPDELRDEVAGAGLAVREVIGVEGLAGWLAQLDARWYDEGDRATIVESARLVEREPSLLGLSAHLLAAAERPA
jgi:ubiquinone/menaquinone biosynthesis C-methylase UbiE